MTDWTGALSDYGWWILGLLLLVLETVLPGVYLLFFGIAALVVGMNVLLIGGAWFGWEQQVLAYVVVSAVAVFLGRKWYGAKAEAQASGTLNKPTQRLIGREAVLSEDLVGGRGRVGLEDSWWSVEGPDLPKGTRVRVVGAEGSVLRVEPTSPPAR
ncbi:NfeD family protein [Aurantimonas sp. HBX-1]|uniref:NfeD family protein n=1 Tax=Aurantimonas sp. HBX-1 TaxID=2906072 RepID=UPI001F487389|nr:NfeD family protein [Aurantimonas sp. HBX-1]UIJ70898.1 NfeD family protein [Aurantimonas sp. HBX-1]